MEGVEGVEGGREGGSEGVREGWRGKGSEERGGKGVKHEGLVGESRRGRERRKLEDY